MAQLPNPNAENENETQPNPRPMRYNKPRIKPIPHHEIESKKSISQSKNYHLLDRPINQCSTASKFVSSFALIP